MEFGLTQNLMHMVQIAEQNFLRMVYTIPEDSGGKVYPNVILKSFRNVCYEEKIVNIYVVGCLCECAKWDKEEADR